MCPHLSHLTSRPPLAPLRQVAISQKALVCPGNMAEAKRLKYRCPKVRKTSAKVDKEYFAISFLLRYYGNMKYDAADIISSFQLSHNLVNSLIGALVQCFGDVSIARRRSDTPMA